MSVVTGDIQVTFLDDYAKNYTGVSNVSIGKDWVFIKFSNGSRTQIPYNTIREMSESPEVYIKGIKETEGKRNA